MGTPRLANQVFTYELKQLDDFAAGRRTDNTLQAMNDVAKGLTQQERRDVSTYVHTLKSPFAGSNLNDLKANGVATNVGIPIGGDRARGRMIVEYGLGDIPACKSCHGFHGRSAGRMFPSLAGQRYIYLVNQLAYWRNGFRGKEPGRHNDPMKMMEDVANRLTDKDIQDVASFLTGAVPFTSGNPHPIPREDY
jgi:cytochrome c553